MSGVKLNSGGPYSNTGVIDGYAYGVAVYGGAGSLTNSGTISASGASGVGVALHVGGTVANAAGGYISGYFGGVWVNGTGGVANALGAIINGFYGDGIYVGGAGGWVTNAGQIQAVGGSGVRLANGGVVTNAQGGTINGGAYGVLIEGAAGTVVDAGGIYAFAGSLNGKTVAVEFTGSGANTLTLQTGSALGGAAIGSTASGATNALILQGAGQAFNNFYNFNMLNVEASGVWTLGGVSVIGATTLTTGTLMVVDAFTTTMAQSVGTTLTIGATATLTLSGTSNLDGSVAGAGTLLLAGGATTIGADAQINVGAWSIGANAVTLDSALAYAFVFALGAGSSVDLSGGAFTLTGLDTFSGGTVDGAYQLNAEGTTYVSGLTLGGTVNFDNSASVYQTGALTLGDPSGAAATLTNSASGIYDFLNDSGIGLGASTASYIANAGLFEKTGGTGTSFIMAGVSGAGEILVASGTLALVGAVDNLSGAIAGSGTLLFAGGAATLSAGASVRGVSLSETGAGTSLTIATNLAYWKNFTQGAGANLIVSAGDTLTLGGTASLAGLVSGPGTLLLLGPSALQAGARIGAAFWNVTGANTTVTVGEALTYSGAFSEGAGAKLSIGAGDALTLAGTSSLVGAIGGAGTLSLTAGTTYAWVGATIGAAFWNVAGAGTTLMLDETTSYAGDFTASDGALLDLATGALTLTGPATFSDMEVNGWFRLFTQGATSVSGLTIGGAANLTNGGVIDQSGDITLGDSSGATASLSNGGTYDFVDDSGVRLGGSAASSIGNTGLFEKTGGTGTSTIAARYTGAGEILVASGTLSLTGTNNYLAGRIAGAGVFSLVGGVTALASGASLSVANFVETGAGTGLVIATNLNYAGAFAEGSGATLNLGAGDTFSFAGTTSLAGVTRGLGTLSLISGTTTVQAGATISARSGTSPGRGPA